MAEFVYSRRGIRLSENIFIRRIKMKRVLVLLMMAIFVISSSGNLLAASQGSKEEAQAMVLKAAAYIKEHGKDKALSEFNNPKGKFVDRDMYVFAYDFSGTNKALVANPALVGKNLIDLKDADGKLMIKDLIGVASNGGGWYEYKWSHPATKEIRAKASYVIKVDDTLWVGCGVYL
jgi:cytochrome c